MRTIQTPKNRPNAQFAPRLVHNHVFLQTADTPDTSRIIRDYGVGADFYFSGNGSTDTVTYTSAGLAITPLVGPALSRKIIDPVNRNFHVVVVGDWSNISAFFTFGSSAANGLAFSSIPGVSGLYQSTGNALISGDHGLSEFGGVSFDGRRNGTLTMKTYLPGDSVTTIGTQTIPDFDVVIDDVLNISGSHIAGIMMLLGNGMPSSQVDIFFKAYVDDLASGTIQIPGSLAGSGF